MRQSKMRTDRECEFYLLPDVCYPMARRLEKGAEVLLKLSRKQAETFPSLRHRYVRELRHSFPLVNMWVCQHVSFFLINAKLHICS